MNAPALLLLIPLASYCSCAASECVSKSRADVAADLYIAETFALSAEDRAAEETATEAHIEALGTSTESQFQVELYKRFTTQRLVLEKRLSALTAIERTKNYAKISDFFGNMVAEDTIPLLKARAKAMTTLDDEAELRAEQAYEAGMAQTEKKIKPLVLTIIVGGANAKREVLRDIALTEFMAAYRNAEKDAASRADALGQAELYKALSDPELAINPALLFASAKLYSRCEEHARAYEKLQSFLSIAGSGHERYQEALGLVTEYRKKAELSQ